MVEVKKINSSLVIMKIIFLSTLLLQFSLIYCQSKYDFKLNKSVEVDLNKSICLNSNNCFYFKTDRGLHHLLLYHSNSGSKRNALMIVDTVDFTDYTSIVHSFSSDNNKREFVVLWETEFESYSYILAYYLIGNQLFKIGELKILLSCQTCEYFGYPIKSIGIRKVNDGIEFLFLKDLNYRISESEEKMFKTGTFKYQYDIGQKKLKVITNQ